MELSKEEKDKIDESPEQDETPFLILPRNQGSSREHLSNILCRRLPYDGGKGGVSRNHSESPLVHLRRDIRRRRAVLRYWCAHTISF